MSNLWSHSLHGGTGLTSIQINCHIPLPWPSYSEKSLTEKWLAVHSMWLKRKKMFTHKLQKLHNTCMAFFVRITHNNIIHCTYIPVHLYLKSRTIITCHNTLSQCYLGSCQPPLRQTGEDNQVVPASRGSAPSNRIWNNTTLYSPEAADLAQNRPLWRMMSMYDATQS